MEPICPFCNYHTWTSIWCTAIHNWVCRWCLLWNPEFADQTVFNKGSLSIARTLRCHSTVRTAIRSEKKPSMQKNEVMATVNTKDSVIALDSDSYMVASRRKQFANVLSSFLLTLKRTVSRNPILPLRTVHTCVKEPHQATSLTTSETKQQL